ncbi:hypothetical protein [Amycolatopsis suaedae]|uniref:WXG100 family type VII secretion target n=1 Tax=Amycolatopsis suaedae TaxID=2510978 RepID=A0A4Q7J6I1_9PSEU|nr:hypothetical protein [Amycolatopsis suaedae]RZQ62747.1 hypothetical protein EWH70_17500 [Amycolatopsis suaedae]
MGAEKYPSIGYDPARGNVETLHTLATELSATATYADEARNALNGVKNNTDVWTGPAAQKFAENIEDLPGYLGDAHWAMEHAGKALKTWADELKQYQQDAASIERDLAAALAKEQQAHAAAEQANATAGQTITYDASNPAAAQAAQAQAQANAQAASQANAAANAATASVEELRRKAEQVLHAWEAGSRTCAARLREAGDRAPDEGFFEGLGEWASGALEFIGDVAGIVSAIAGVLAFIPIVNVVAAPVALIAGGVALASHVGDIAINGKWTDWNAWIGVAGDAFGMIPGVKAVQKGLDAAGEAVDLGAKVVQGGKAFKDDMAEASANMTALASKLPGMTPEAAATAAKVYQGTLSTALQVPALGGLTSDSDQAKTVKDVGGAGGAVLSWFTRK